MNRCLTALVVLFLATAAFGQQQAAAKASAAPADRLEKLVRAALPICSAEQTVKRSETSGRFPTGMSGAIFDVESSLPACSGRYVAVQTQNGGVFLGTVWWLDQEKGNTTEEKLYSFLWRVMQRPYTPVIDKTLTPFGTRRVVLNETTEYGKVPLEGEIDAKGELFFVGHFRPQNADPAAERVKAFEPLLATAPSRGTASPKVTILEFSDFQCPSCKRSANYVDSILAKHGDSVRYVRIDLPLMSMHPWAFAASLAGRAIYRQKPELFWEYKKQIYEQQADLTAFTVDRVAWLFAESNGLDMKKFEADLASQEVRDSILSGVGKAFSHDVRSTPTYMVNGAVVEAGEEGKALAAYVEKVLAK